MARLGCARGPTWSADHCVYYHPNAMLRILERLLRRAHWKEPWTNIAHENVIASSFA